MYKTEFFWFSQKSFLFPAHSETELYDRINESDFLVCDSSGTHRMVGLRYEEKKMNAPIITFVVMRQEVSVAKQIAYALGKKIYFSNKDSASLFQYKRNEMITEKDVLPVARLYARFLMYYKKES